METRPSKKSNRVSVTLHFVPGKDDDLLEMLVGVPLGGRQEHLKSRLRGQATVPAPAPTPTANLQPIENKLDWIWNALTDPEGELANTVRRIVAERLITAAPVEPAVDNEALKQRATRLKKNQW